jgi:hypothetical protein
MVNNAGRREGAGAISGEGAMVADKGVELKWSDYPLGFVFRDNAVQKAAFKLATLGTADLGRFAKRHVFVIEVADCRLRRPIRSVRLFAYSESHGGEAPGDPGTVNNQPTPQPGDRPTRFDIDSTGLVADSRAQAVMLRVVLGPGLEFWPPSDLPAITAKTSDGATRLVNLAVDTDSQGRPRASFWSLSTKGNQGSIVIDGFNIAVVATDDQDPLFALPVIIDPVIRNRNG